MIDANTIVCAVVGSPIRHSFSPAIHNAGYKHLGLNAVYVAFEVTDVRRALEGIRALGIRGVSVTIPHKVAIMKYLDKIDPIAEMIGAVNTVINKKGTLVGYNTDWVGALTALQEKTKLTGKKVLVLGAGGSAKAIIAGLLTENLKVTVAVRDVQKAQKALKRFKKIAIEPISPETIERSDIIINTTPIGMHPHENHSLVPASSLHAGHVIFDIVYNPKETMLIRNAQEKGCTIVYGYKMLLYQAIDQFRLMTDENPPVEVMEKALINMLSSRT